MEPSSPFILCYKNNKTVQHDIDINYAIGLLKKEDQNINVYVLFYQNVNFL